MSSSQPLESCVDALLLLLLLLLLWVTLHMNAIQHSYQNINK
jgi:hypothetical protein